MKWGLAFLYLIGGLAVPVLGALANDQITLRAAFQEMSQLGLKSYTKAEDGAFEVSGVPGGAVRLDDKIKLTIKAKTGKIEKAFYTDLIYADSSGPLLNSTEVDRLNRKAEAVIRQERAGRPIEELENSPEFQVPESSQVPAEQFMEVNKLLFGDMPDGGMFSGLPFLQRLSGKSDDDVFAWDVPLKPATPLYGRDGEGRYSMTRHPSNAMFLVVVFTTDKRYALQPFILNIVGQ